MSYSSVSVAMAAYNGESYIRQQIDSILSQLKPIDELVISYDESSDSTLSILRDYEKSDSRVRVLFNSQPGVIGNFNNAIRSCVCDVVFISDQDDIWLSGKREKVLSRLNETGADLLIHDLVHIDKAGRVISGSVFQSNDVRKGLFRNFAKPRYSGCCMAFPQSTKRLILPMPGSVECYDHWVGMVCEVFGKVDFYNEVLIQHRLHGSNVTVSRRPFLKVASQRLNLLLELLRKRQELSK